MAQIRLLADIVHSKYSSIYNRPLGRIFLKFRLADTKIQLISGLAEYSRNLRKSAGIWLTNDKFG